MCKKCFTFTCWDLLAVLYMQLINDHYRGLVIYETNTKVCAVTVCHVFQTDHTEYSRMPLIIIHVKDSLDQGN